MLHVWVIGVLLGAAVVLTLLCCIGVLVMRDPYQRLQFVTPVATIGAVLVTAAVWVGDPSWQARLKMLCIGAVLFWMNAILSHATARAVRIRRAGHFSPKNEEKIPVVEHHGYGGGK